MNEQQQETAQPAGERVYERCLCREAIDWWANFFQVPQETRQHIRNSRIEFLKAVRSVIDDRIAHLSSRNQEGTTVRVE
ncbi:MAG: hypothetical protein ACM336_08295 [Acidobacteriota bacterium]